MNRWLVILLVFSLAVNLAAVGSLFYFAQRPGPRGPGLEMPMGPPDGAGGEGPRRLFRGMDVPPDHRPEVRRLRNAFQDSLRPLVREMMETRQDLMRLIVQKPAASDSINMLVLRINTLQGEMEKRTVRHLIAMRPFLDEKQWQKLTRMLERKMLEPPLARPKGSIELP